MLHLCVLHTCRIRHTSAGRLKSLTLKETEFLTIKYEMFLPIPHLQTLDLSESKIKSLDFLMLANLSALRFLNLADNDISVVNETVFQYLPSLTYLDLSNNPFTCECLNAGFIRWVKSNKQTQVFNGHQYVCSFPVSKRGTLLLDFDVKTCWEDGSFLYFISSTCLVVLTLLTSFVYNFLRWHLKYTFHLFWAFLYDSRKRKNMNPHQFDAFVSYNVHDEGWVYREIHPTVANPLMFSEFTNIQTRRSVSAKIRIDKSDF
uniref:TIR domain-containing protein n=1 Tax=Poecilia reticulata TaxID=8081 RepID=A0A3P9PSF1_POERE